MSNVITATFNGKNICTTDPAFEHNYGQVLYFADLSLPSSFEVHFANKETGTSITQIGSSNQVTIPDSVFTGLPRYYQSNLIYAWVYLHTGENDGETAYQVTIPLLRRAEPSDDEPSTEEQSTITQTIAALNSAVEEVEDIKVPNISEFANIKTMWDSSSSKYRIYTSLNPVSDYVFLAGNAYDASTHFMNTLIMYGLSPSSFSKSYRVQFTLLYLYGDSSYSYDSDGMLTTSIANKSTIYPIITNATTRPSISVRLPLEVGNNHIRLGISIYDSDGTLIREAYGDQYSFTLDSNYALTTSNHIDCSSSNVGANVTNDSAYMVTSVTLLKCRQRGYGFYSIIGDSSVSANVCLNYLASTFASNNLTYTEIDANDLYLSGTGYMGITARVAMQNGTGWQSGFDIPCDLMSHVTT